MQALPQQRASAPYLESHNKRPFFNTKSSFFRGNSPLSLHFQWKIQQNKSAFILQFEYPVVLQVLSRLWLATA